MRSDRNSKTRSLKRKLGKNPLVFHTYQFVFRALLNPMNKGNRLQSSRNYLKWYLVTKPKGKTVDITLFNGMKSTVHPDSDSGVSHIFDNGFDYLETAFIRKILEQGDLMVDAGCNVGNRTIALADMLGGGILIDANPNCLLRAEENLRLNNLSLKNFQFIHSAVGKSNAVVEFPLDAGTSCQNSIGNTATKSEMVQVPMVTLDSMIEELGNPEIAFLKTDLEGYDLEALRGAPRLLKSKSLKLVVFERWPNTDLDEFIRLFGDMGWDVFALDDRGEPSSQRNLLETRNNLIALPRTNHQLGENI